MRKIIHIDMDAFFASVEQRDFPALRGRPLVVGGSPDGRGVVAAASYEARQYGVKSAMSSRQALQLCPELLFTKPRFDVYKEVSQQLRAIFSRYTDLIEPLSLDEAFLDVTHDKQGIGSAIAIAQQIQAAVVSELQLTASAGISINKFVAKIASDYQKPHGLTFIGPSKVIAFMEQLPIDGFFGVGKVTAQKMKAIGIFKGVDLKRFTEQELVQLFGKSGRVYYAIVRGQDDRPVRPNRVAKSIAAEDTFETDISDKQVLMEELRKLSERVARRLVEKHKKGRTLTLKVRYADFQQLTRSCTLSSYIDTSASIYDVAALLLEKVNLEHSSLRLLGLSMSNFKEDEGLLPRGGQLQLFHEEKSS